MVIKKNDLAIINRAFWPKSPVIGEALLKLAEEAAKSGSVCVITQSSLNISKKLMKAKRGKRVNIKACSSFSNVNSNLITRLLDGFIFMLWTSYSLIITRPKKIYISTNPPIFLPFIVFLYSAIFRAKYYYHLQDIHPEAANIIIPLNRHLFRFLSWLDSIVMRHASGIMTLSEEMKQYILSRSKTTAPILLVDNPAFIDTQITTIKKTKDIVFCGTAGRLQRIPLLLKSISEYLEEGGTLNFTFIGSGVYLSEIKKMSQKYSSVSCLGFLPSEDAAAIVGQHHWALLPINDEVTRYAFPSRSSSYVVSNCKILAICSKNTSVATWLEENKLGIVSSPDVPTIVSYFKAIEKGMCVDFNQTNKIDFSTALFVKKTLAFIEK